MEHVERTIKDLQVKITEKEKELNDEKDMVNRLCKMLDKPPIYEIKKSVAAHSPHLKGDEYYGRPLATVITKVLQARKNQGLGPATIREVFEQMKVGGYRFDAKNDQNAIRNVRISMAKNTKFHRLPTKKWGLTEWYPKIKESAKSELTNDKSIVADIIESEPDNSENEE